VLSLREGKLVQQPAPELAKLRGESKTKRNFRLHNESFLLEPATGDLREIIAELEMGEASSAGLKVRRSADGKRAVQINYNGATLDVAGTKVPFKLPADEHTLKLRVFLDKAVMEVYANDGQECVTRVIYPEEQDQAIELFASGGAATVKSIDTWSINATW
jgi:sucrose-6-phosphate hydrolase SacC (GH32 family)